MSTTRKQAKKKQAKKKQAKTTPEVTAPVKDVEAATVAVEVPEVAAVKTAKTKSKVVKTKNPFTFDVEACLYEWLQRTQARPLLESVESATKAVKAGESIVCVLDERGRAKFVVGGDTPKSRASTRKDSADNNIVHYTMGLLEAAQKIEDAKS